MVEMLFHQEVALSEDMNICWVRFSNTGFQTGFCNNGLQRVSGPFQCSWIVEER